LTELKPRKNNQTHDELDVCFAFIAGNKSDSIRISRWWLSKKKESADGIIFMRPRNSQTQRDDETCMR
jgi:hypothetical protein